MIQNWDLCEANSYYIFDIDIDQYLDLLDCKTSNCGTRRANG